MLPDKNIQTIKGIYLFPSNPESPGQPGFKIWICHGLKLEKCLVFKWQGSKVQACLYKETTLACIRMMYKTNVISIQ